MAVLQPFLDFFGQTEILTVILRCVPVQKLWHKQKNTQKPQKSPKTLHGYGKYLFSYVSEALFFVSTATRLRENKGAEKF